MFNNLISNILFYVNFLIILGGVLKRALGIIFIFFLLISCCNGASGDTLISCFKNESIDMIICENDNGYQLLKCDERFYKNVLKKLNVVIVNKYYIDDRIIIEGYTHKFKKYIISNGMKINVQLSIFDNHCLIGYPLIKNSF